MTVSAGDGNIWESPDKTGTSGESPDHRQCRTRSVEPLGGTGSCARLQVPLYLTGPHLQAGRRSPHTWSMTAHDGSPPSSRAARGVAAGRPPARPVARIPTRSPGLHGQSRPGHAQSTAAPHMCARTGTCTRAHIPCTHINTHICIHLSTHLCWCPVCVHVHHRWRAT